MVLHILNVGPTSPPGACANLYKVKCTTQAVPTATSPPNIFYFTPPRSHLCNLELPAQGNRGDLISPVDYS